jgi:N12 class adenine-specific DNA methylase
VSQADHHLELERPYGEADPLDMDDARKASRRVSEMRRSAEAELRAAIEDRGQKEGAYRKALAQAIVRMRQEHPATVAVDMAKGEDDVQEAMIAFRIAEGMVDAHKERLKTIEGDRSQLKSLIDWSSSIANVLREHGGAGHEPSATETHGRGLREAA